MCEKLASKGVSELVFPVAAGEDGDIEVSSVSSHKLLSLNPSNNFPSFPMRSKKSQMPH